MALDIFGDFGFVGGEDNYLYQDAQTCINFYPEISQSEAAKSAVSLRGSPGLVQLVAASGGGAPGNQSSTFPLPSTVTNLPVRGFWVLPGQTTALCVIANTCYLVKALSIGSTNSPGTISLTNVGTLLTFSGPVSIRDNNTGGFAVIVDGVNGYTYNLVTQAFAQIVDSNFVGWGATTVCFIDGWWIFSANQTFAGASQLFFTNAPIYTNTFNGTFFALKDGASDNLMAVIENKEELWLIGERTTEVWYNSGGALFSFQRLGGGLQQFGCKATYSVARMKSQTEDCLIWFGRNEQGENVVLRTQGFNTGVVSTPAVSDAIATYTTTSDAIGYCYQEDGHQFYVLTFPSADKTWVYDATMPLAYAWTQRASYDPYTQTYHRHRSNCYMNFAGMRIVGDYQNGALYQMTRNAYTDAGWPIKAQRRSPYIWDKEERRRMRMAELQIEFAPGVGNSIITYPQPNQNNTGYFANAVTYDGSTTFLSRNSALSGIANGKTGTFDCWVNIASVPAAGGDIFAIRTAANVTVFTIQILPNGKFQILGSNSGLTQILSASTVNSYSSSSGNLNLQISWNLATATVNLYVNGVPDVAVTMATNDTLDYNEPNVFIGCTGTVASPSKLWNGSMAEVFLSTSFIDITSALNRALFATSGYPTYLGLTGQIPTGTSPVVYMNGSNATIGTNNGTGGNFTVNGTFLAATSPSTPPIGTLTSGIGSNPQAKLRLSRDYGTTYGEPILSPLGQIGNYVNRCIWRKLGWTRGTVAEIEVIDPVKRDIVGATLRARS